MAENLYEVLRSGFPKDGSACALRLHDGATVSYTEVQRSSNQYCAALRSLGLHVGDRVAVQVDKSPQALFLYLACLQGGFAYLPMNVAYQDAEVRHILQDARPSLLVCRQQDAQERADVVREADVKHQLTLSDRNTGSLVELSMGQPENLALAACGGDDLAALLYTSGTTGKPKGVMLSHNNLISNARVLLQAWGWSSDDVLIHALPLFHTHGLFVACHCALMGGSEMLFFSKFDADEVLRVLPDATVLMGVPTFYTRLLSNPSFGRDRCRNIRLFVSGSAPLLETTFDEFVQRTGKPILERYGMTETGMNTSNPLNGERLAGTVGFPLPGVDVRVVDDNDVPLTDTTTVGHVQVRGPNVFSGYWRQPDKTQEEFSDEGFFKTGDLGRFDERGYLHLVGRSKDLIISGGFNIYPKEIELLIDEMPGVVESAVIGIPDADFGEAVVAVVVGSTGVLSQQSMIADLKGQLASYKVPKRVVFQEQLPRNAMGKVQKNRLRDVLSNTG